MNLLLSVLAIFGLLLTGNPGLAKDRAFTIEGHGRNEFTFDLFVNSCLKAKGWEPKVSFSEKRPPKGVDFVRAEFDRVLGPESILSPNLESATALEALASLVSNQIKEAASDLKAGDQFLLRIAAHGSDLCPGRNSSPFDTTPRLNADQQDCDHAISIKFPGMAAPIWLPTKLLLPALKELKGRGVKVAADVFSCYGGASIKDFAEAGICAHAYATPNRSMFGDPGVPSNSANMMSAVLCRGLDRRQIQSGVNLTNLRKEDLDWILNGISLLPEPSSGSRSIEDWFDSARAKDQEMNQPLGTDGPYWIIGNLGAMGLSTLDLNQLSEVPTLCDPKREKFFEKLAESVDAVTRELLGHRQECSFRRFLDEFFEKERAKGTFNHFFANLDRAQKAASRKNSFLRRTLSPDRQIKMAREAVEYIIRQDGNQSPEARDEIRRAATADPQSQIFAVLLSSDIPYFQKLTAKYIPSSALVDKILSDEYSRMEEANIDTKELEKNLAQVERKLYSTLKKSKEYQQCLASNPKLKESAQSCKDFHL